MNKYIIILLIFLSNNGYSSNLIKNTNSQFYPNPPEKISLNGISNSIIEYNKNIDIANLNKYQIQKVRVFLLSFSPLLVHGVYRINKNIKNVDLPAGNIIGSIIESTIGFAFTLNGIKIESIMWREENERKSAVDNCIRLYNSITVKPAVKIKDIKTY